MFSKLFLCLALSGLGAGVAVPSSQIVERGADFVSEQLVGFDEIGNTPSWYPIGLYKEIVWSNMIYGTPTNGIATRLGPVSLPNVAAFGTQITPGSGGIASMQIGSSFDHAVYSFTLKSFWFGCLNGPVSQPWAMQPAACSIRIMGTSISGAPFGPVEYYFSGGPRMEEINVGGAFPPLRAVRFLAPPDLTVVLDAVDYTTQSQFFPVPQPF